MWRHSAKLNGRVVSGVGGQYNFVAQAFALQGARSIIVLPATRATAGRMNSNIRWNYGHTTIPRHLRDIMVTEYGIADLRGKSDREVIAAMLSVADSRFQGELLARAKEKATQAISLRVPVADIEAAKKIAARRGVGYQTVLKHAIREGLKKRSA